MGKASQPHLSHFYEIWDRNAKLEHLQQQACQKNKKLNPWYGNPLERVVCRNTDLISCTTAHVVTGKTICLLCPGFILPLYCREKLKSGYCWAVKIKIAVVPFFDLPKIVWLWTGYLLLICLINLLIWLFCHVCVEPLTYEDVFVVRKTFKSYKQKEGHLRTTWIREAPLSFGATKCSENSQERGGEEV